MALILNRRVKPLRGLVDLAPMLNVIQRVGGSLGTAVLAVVLETQLRAVTPGRGSVADAFAHTYWWAFGACALAVVPALVLARTQPRQTTRPEASVAATSGTPGR